MMRFFKPGEIRRVERMKPECLVDITWRVILVTAVLFVTFCAGWLVAMETGRAEGTTVYVCTESDLLNVREAADIHARVEYKLARGDAATLLQTDKYGWAEIVWVGQRGWCRAEYLSPEPPPRRLTMEELLAVEPEP